MAGAGAAAASSWSGRRALVKLGLNQTELRCNKSSEQAGRHTFGLRSAFYWPRLAPEPEPEREPASNNRPALYKRRRLAAARLRVHPNLRPPARLIKRLHLDLDLDLDLDLGQVQVCSGGKPGRGGGGLTQPGSLGVGGADSAAGCCWRWPAKSDQVEAPLGPTDRPTGCCSTGWLCSLILDT